MVSFLVLLAVDLLGLAGIWFLLKAKMSRALELDSLLDSIRKEVRALNIELNETTDRNISLVEDRMKSLHELLDEADRRMGVVKRELGRREIEREVYNHLGRRAQGATQPREAEPAAVKPPAALPSTVEVAPVAQIPPAPRPQASPEGAGEGPIRLSFSRERESGPSRPLPEVVRAEGSVIPPKTRREEALDLYREGFSADIIAKRLGATVAEIELLISLEEGRARGGSDSHAN
jgi:hypothetical protein